MNLVKLLSRILVASGLLAFGLVAGALALSASNPFAGAWGGPYAGSNGDSGTVTIEITPSGVMSGKLINGGNVVFDLRGHVNAQGKLSAVGLAPPDAVVPFGGTMELVGGSILGTYGIRNNDVHGVFEFAPLLSASPR